MRKQGSYLEEEIMQGKCQVHASEEDHARPGWTTSTLSMKESIIMTEDTEKWRKYVHNVANPRIEDG